MDTVDKETLNHLQRQQNCNVVNDTVIGVTYGKENWTGQTNSTRLFYY